MNYGELKSYFIRYTGRNDLTQAGNEAELAFFINSGQRYLDRKAVHRNSKERVIVDVVASQWVVTLLELRTMDMVWIITDEGRSELAKISLHQFYQLYPLASDVDTGIPIYYALDVSPESMVYNNTTVRGSNTVVDGTFPGDTNWTIGNSNWSIAGTAIHDGPSSTMTQPFADQLDGSELVIGSTYQVSYEITAWDNDKPGVVYVLLGGSFGKRRHKIGKYFEDIVCKESTTIGITAESSSLSDVGLTIDNLSVRETTRNYTYGGAYTAPGRLVTQHGANILIAPPPDATYSLEFIGKFYDTELVADSDRSWWSENEPDLLVIAAAYRMETFFRNTEGSRDWRIALEEQLDGLDFDAAEEESQPGRQMHG